MELNREQSDKFKKFLKDKLPTNRKNSWFENLQLLKITTSNVIFGGITHRVYRYEIKTNHEFLLVKVLDELFPEYSPFSSKIFVYNIGVVKENKKSIQAEFDFNITNIGKKIKKPYIKKENSLKNKNTAFNYNYNHFFSSFIPGERNLLAIRSSKVVVEMPGIAFNPFVIYGESGSGKTHLLEAINNESHKINSKLSSVNVSTEDFLNDFINHLRTNKMKDFRDLYRKADIFLLDDLESILPSKKCQNELLHTIKTLRKKKSQIVITCEKPPTHINELNPGLRMILESGLTVDVGIPEDKTKIEILKKKASEKGIPLTSELANFIVYNIKGGIGKMEGILMRIGVHVSLLNKKLTINLLKDILKDWLNVSNKKSMIVHEENVDQTISKILDRIKVLYQVEDKELISYRRDRRHIKARQAVVYLLKKLTKLSLNEIGNIIGRNHSTVHAILKKLRHKIMEDDFFQKQMNNILDEFDNKKLKENPEKNKKEVSFESF